MVEEAGEWGPIHDMGCFAADPDATESPNET